MLQFKDFDASSYFVFVKSMSHIFMDTLRHEIDKISCTLTRFSLLVPPNFTHIPIIPISHTFYHVTRITCDVPPFKSEAMTRHILRFVLVSAVGTMPEVHLWDQLEYVLSLTLTLPWHARSTVPFSNFNPKILNVL